MSAAVMVKQKFFGLIELDSDGTILYARIESHGVRHLPAPNITGRNFYSEVAPFQNVAEFQQQLDSFRLSAHQAHTMTFTCEYEDGPLTVRVLLARVGARSDGAVSNSILVHIRNAQ